MSVFDEHRRFWADHRLGTEVARWLDADADEREWAWRGVCEERERQTAMILQWWTIVKTAVELIPEDRWTALLRTTALDRAPEDETSAWRHWRETGSEAAAREYAVAYLALREYMESFVETASAWREGAA